MTSDKMLDAESPPPDSKNAYCAPPAEEVGQLARTGAKWSILLLIARQVIGVGVAGILARLLSPGDFGLLAMVATITGFLTLISDMGLSWATVYDRDADFHKTNSLFWAGGTLGGVAWLLCIVSAPLAVWFYKRTELYPICIVMGAFLLINGFASQPLALLKKRIRQKELSLTQLFGTIIAGASAIGLAWLSAGYWALVAQTLVAVLVTLAFAMFWSGFWPGRPNFAIGSGRLLKFGGLIGACNIITFLQVNLDSILIGHYCTAAELGFYSRAFYLRTLPALYVSMAVTDVMIPAFSALSADKERMAAAFRKVVTLMAFIGFPIAAGMGITAHETVRIIYGSKWAEVAPLLQWLTLPAMILPVTQSMGWIFISLGKVRQMFYLTSATFPLVLTVLWYAVSSKGIMGIVVAIAILYSLPLPLITIFFAFRVASLSLKKTFLPVIKIGLISLLAAAGAWSAGYLAELAAMNWIAVFVCKCSTGAVLYIALSLQLLNPLPVYFLENALGGFRWKV